MDRQAMRERLAGARVARLATIGDDGAPHLVPICFALDGDVLVNAVDGKPKRSRELRRLGNVRARPTATVIADHYEEDWSRLWWVRAGGHAEVLAPGSPAEGRAIDLLVAKYGQYRVARPAGPVLAVTLARWRGWAAADVPGG